jgi:hypothetical protein
MTIEAGNIVTVKRNPTTENSRTIVSRAIKEVNSEKQTFVCDDNIVYKFSDIRYVAKSGRAYRSIPDEVDIETWDKMTPKERLIHLGLINNPNEIWYNPYEEKS